MENIIIIYIINLIFLGIIKYNKCILKIILKTKLRQSNGEYRFIII